MIEIMLLSTNLLIARPCLPRQHCPFGPFQATYELRLQVEAGESRLVERICRDHIPPLPTDPTCTTRTIGIIDDQTTAEAHTRPILDGGSTGLPRIRERQ